MLLFGVLSVMAAAVTAMASFHLYLGLFNITTNERVKRQRLQTALKTNSGQIPNHQYEEMKRLAWSNIYNRGIHWNLLELLLPFLALKKLNPNYQEQVTRQMEARPQQPQPQPQPQPSKLQQEKREMKTNHDEKSKYRSKKRANKMD